MRSEKEAFEATLSHLVKFDPNLADLNFYDPSGTRTRLRAYLETLGYSVTLKRRAVGGRVETERDGYVREYACRDDTMAMMVATRWSLEGVKANDGARPRGEHAEKRAQP